MLADHIIEESYPSYVNHLTLVQRDGKRVRIANMFMTPNRATVPPMQMLFQRFHGASYTSTLDLSSAFYKYLCKKPQENGQRSSSITRCNNFHAYHMVSEILSALLLGHSNRYCGLTLVNMWFIM